jgi:hypothetical protein
MSLDLSMPDTRGRPVGFQWNAARSKNASARDYRNGEERAEQKKFRGPPQDMRGKTDPDRNVSHIAGPCGM